MHDEVLLDLQLSQELTAFKRHMLEQTALSVSQEPKYLLYCFLAKSEKEKELSVGFTNIKHAVLTSEDLKKLLCCALRLDAFLVFTLEKFHVYSSGQRQRKKQTLEFDIEGGVKAERKHLLNYERPNHKIYPVFDN